MSDREILEESTTDAEMGATAEGWRDAPFAGPMERVGGRWGCSCGWSGGLGEMTIDQSERLCCPACLASSGRAIEVDDGPEDRLDAPDAELKGHFDQVDMGESVVRETFAALLSVGYTEEQARSAIGSAQFSGRRFSSVPEMIEAIYAMRRDDISIPDTQCEELTSVESGHSEELDDDIRRQIEEATAEVCRAQEEHDQAEHEEEQAIAAKKAATLKRESKAEWLNDAARRLRKLRAGQFPDGDRYPMFDRPNGESTHEVVNGMFPKPEATPPLPPDTFEEFVRREREATRLDQVGLKPAALKALSEAGLVTVGDLARKSDALAEAGVGLTTIRGITEARLGHVTDALSALMLGWQERWGMEHPAEGGEANP